MSHFTVMIIGNNPERQLKPFDEGIEMPEYKTGVVSEKDLKTFKETYTIYKEGRSYGVKSNKEAKENSKLTISELYEKKGNDWNSGCWKLESDGSFGEYSTYSPKSKWDWYSLGGRWKGFLKLKEGKTGVLGESGAGGNEAPKGNFADQAELGDIDIKRIIKDARAEAKKRYQKVEKAMGGSIPKIKIKWAEICDDEGKYKDIEWSKRNDIYHSQPEIELFNKNCKELVGFFGSIDDYQLTKEEYIEDAGNGALSTFAVLKDGEWYEKGTMGWWGMVSDKKEQGNWNKEIVELLKGLPSNTLISIYDCHI